ncbi:unnamed protein product [Phyllotreta striolata]|uniref:PH domain-containing protein n=1 Tax=Phyllotreta striolata TaxID=444603 RepID=A0A9N9TNX7_PHYSR|nr:unnamed protein product [Phyllotreta striolata]
MTPPKKPPRLHLNLKPNTPAKNDPIIYANIQPQPQKNLLTTDSSTLEKPVEEKTSHDAQVKNAILEVTNALKSTVQGDTFANDLYSDFRDGLKRKRPSSPPIDAKDEKFVVNIFESRQSQRWKRQSVRVDRVPKIKILDDPPKEMIHKQPPVDENEKTVPTNDEIYYKMKKMRDIECVKMKEASNALMAIKNNAQKTLSEELLAETILLETGLRYKAIVNKIRDCINENEPVVKKTCVSAGLTLSNFQFEIEPQAQKKTDSTFFLLAISNDTEIIATKAIQPSGDNKLAFKETFALKNLSENFKIKGEIFSITFNTRRPGIVEKLLRKKSKYYHSINKIYYENVNTYELQESAIIKSSFTSRGEFTMTKKDIYNSMFLLTNYDSDKLKNVVSMTASLDYMNLNDKLSGFLTLGKVNEQQYIHDWERKWCSLVDKTFSIYNYPQDEEQEKPPVAVINLEYCFNPIARKPQNCPRKRTFVIKTGRPSTMNDSNCKHLKRKNNFILNKYYLSADNNNDFEQWTSKLDSALDELDQWGRLIFKDESYM